MNHRLNSYLAAKTDPQNTDLWLPLWIHSRDTAEVMRCLAINQLSDGARAALGLEEAILSKTAYFLGAVQKALPPSRGLIMENRKKMDKGIQMKIQRSIMTTITEREKKTFGFPSIELCLGQVATMCRLSCSQPHYRPNVEENWWQLIEERKLQIGNFSPTRDILCLHGPREPSCSMQLPYLPSSAKLPYKQLWRIHFPNRWKKLWRRVDARESLSTR